MARRGAARFTPKATGGGGGIAAWIARIIPGIQMSQVVNGTSDKPLVKTGVTVSQSPVGLVTPQNPAVATSLLGVSGSASVAQNPAVAMGTVMQSTLLSEVPAAKIVQIKYDLNHTSGPTVASSSGTGSWTNPTNAQGIHDGASATHAGNLTAAHDTHLTMDFNDFTNKDALTIVSVVLNFYVAQSGTLLNNGDLRLYAGTVANAEATLLETITGNVSSLSTPRSFDVSASYTTWTALNNLRAAVRHLTDIGESGITGTVDSVELVVTATATQAA